MSSYRHRLPLLSALALALAGCETTNNPPVQAVQAPALPAPPAAAAEPPSALSYGMVTGRVKKDVTTQLEIIELFGGPSTMTTDKDGTEVWMFDKTTSTVSGSSAQSAAQAQKSSASAMGAFLGLPVFGGIGAVGGGVSSSQSQSAQVSQGTSTMTRSVKTITFIIKFNADKTVKDYAVRQASY